MGSEPIPYKLNQYGHAILKDGTTTNPYNLLQWAIGSCDDFHCFDYLDLGDSIALHSVINSETGSFIQDGFYLICPKRAGLINAMEMLGEAISWVAENDVEMDDGWGHSCVEFLDAVAGTCGTELSDNDRKYFLHF